ncbi:MAG: hypothetical protein V1663_01785 [archaeon]
MGDFKEADSKELSKSLLGLPFLLSECAIDLENYRLGISKDLNSIEKLTEIIREYQLKDNSSTFPFPFSGPNTFSYYSLGQSILNSGKYPNRNFNPSELALEMGLLKLELENIPYSNPERLSEITLFLCDFSKESMNEYRFWTQPHRLVA